MTPEAKERLEKRRAALAIFLVEMARSVDDYSAAAFVLAPRSIPGIPHRSAERLLAEHMQIQLAKQPGLANIVGGTLHFTAESGLLHELESHLDTQDLEEQWGKDN